MSLCFSRQVLVDESVGQTNWGRAEAWISEVDGLMRQLATGERVEGCGRRTREALDAGGRRIRARLSIVTSLALDVSRQDAVCWAAAVELVHNATLVHDDIQDGDTYRRGRETVWVTHGVGQAINVGDLMLVLPYQALDRMDAPAERLWYLSRALAYRSAQTVRGQAEDMSLMTNRLFDWESYVRVAEGKSGQLLGLPVEGAAILAGISPEVARELGDVYATLGTLYQLQDDVLDLYGVKGRVPGTDLREGKVTALVSAHLERYPDETEELVALLEAPAEEVSAEQVAVYRRRFREGGAIADVCESIGSLREALQSASVLIERPRLLEVATELADWIVRELDEHMSHEQQQTEA